MKANYLLYFCDGIGSVFESQVLALLTAISKKEYFEKIYLFLGIRGKKQEEYILSMNLPCEIELVFFKSWGNYPVFNYLIRNSIKRALLSSNIDLNKAIFHTRGELIAWHLYSILEKPLRKRIIPDIRGTSVEEIQEFYDMNSIQKRIKIFNNKSALNKLSKFSRISVVSSSLREYLTNNYNIESGKIYLNPCLAGIDFKFNESERLKIRNKLNLFPEDILIVFSSGGTAEWQNNEMIIKLADKRLKVLNLSKKKFNHKNIINKFVSYSEMPSYLNAADVAIIWRDKSVVNETASPVKFSEYICCGLPVIANRNVKMITDYIKTNGCGLLVDSLEEIDLNQLSMLKHKDRTHISESGIMKFGINEIVNKYFQIYS